MAFLFFFHQPFLILLHNEDMLIKCPCLICATYHHIKGTTVTLVQTHPLNQCSLKRLYLKRYPLKINTIIWGTFKQYFPKNVTLKQLLAHHKRNVLVNLYSSSDGNRRLSESGNTIVNPSCDFPCKLRNERTISAARRRSIWVLVRWW